MRHKRTTAATRSHAKQLFLLAAESISRLGGRRQTLALRVTPPDLHWARAAGGGGSGGVGTKGGPVKAEEEVDAGAGRRRRWRAGENQAATCIHD